MLHARVLHPAPCHPVHSAMSSSHFAFSLWHLHPPTRIRTTKPGKLPHSGLDSHVTHSSRKTTKHPGFMIRLPSFPGLPIFTLPNPLLSVNETQSLHPTDKQISVTHSQCEAAELRPEGLIAYRQSILSLIVWYEKRDRLGLKIKFGDFGLRTKQKSRSDLTRIPGM